MLDHNIIRYAGTSKKRNVHVFVDANLTSDQTDWKSICRYVFTIFEGAIYIDNTNQRYVTGFTTETEYIVLSLAF